MLRTRELVPDPMVCSFEVKEVDAEWFIESPTGRLVCVDTAGTGSSSSLSEPSRNEGFSLSIASHVSTCE